MTEELKEVEQEEKAHLVGIPDNMMVPIAVTSFEDLDAMIEANEMVGEMKETTHQFAEMAENIFLNDEIEDKAEALQKLAGEFASRVSDATKEETDEDCADCEEKEISGWQKVLDGFANFSADLSKQERTCKTEGGVCYPAADYASVPDRTKPSTWKLRLSEGRPGNITTRQLGRAAAAFSSGGFRGQRVRLSGSEASSAKARIRREYRKLNADIPDSIKGFNSFYLWKEAGQYKWLAVYSNNIRDNDNPPEIIAESSHQRFVELVDKGQVPLPELWLWHIKEWKWGEATSVAYDDKGFACALGNVDRNEAAESVAKWLKERDDILTSHGMPRPTISRDKEDNTVITEHITREISPLFDWAAANKFTGFTVLKEQSMAIPDEKRQAFIDAGLGPEVLEALEQQNEATADKASEAGLETKEEDAEEEEQEEKQDDLVETVRFLAGQVASLMQEVKELKKPAEEKVGDLPPATLLAYAQGLFKEENKSTDETELPGPVEAEAAKQEQGLFFQEWLPGKGVQ